MYNAQDVQAYLNEHFDEIVDCRHHLHQYPEIGLVLMKYIKTLAVLHFLR